MNARTFAAKITIRQGELEHTTLRLLVANNLELAYALSEAVICMMYCEPEDADVQDGTVMVYGGEVAISVHSVREIGLSTFLEMSSMLGIPCYCDDGLTEPTSDALADLKGVSAAISKALQAQRVDVTHSQVLNATSAAMGARNWGQYKATAIVRKDVQLLLAHCEDVAGAADDTGCEAPWTVTDGSAIVRMSEAAKSLKEMLAKQGN